MKKLILYLLAFSFILVPSLVFADDSLPYSVGSSLSGTFPSYSFEGSDNAFTFNGSGSYHVEGTLNLINSTNSGHFAVYFTNNNRVQNFSLTNSLGVSPSNYSWFDGYGLYSFSFDIVSGSSPSSFSFTVGPGNRLQSCSGQITFTTFTYNDSNLILPDNLVTNPSFTLPCGWYAEFSNIQDSITVNGSSTFSGSIGWQDNTNSYFYGIDSDNQSTTSQRLQWNKVNGVLGFTKNGSFTQTFSTLSKYVIVNPAYMVSNSSSDLGRAIPNPSISISVVGSCVVTLKSFSSTPYFNNTNQNYDVSIDSTNGTVLTLDPDDGLFYDSYGDSVTPNQGGLTDISSYSNDYQNNLLGLVRSIQDLLNRGQDEVSTLSQSGSGFMSVVRQMFGWLPTDVVNVVTSSLIVIVIIGMLKVFL